MEVKNGGNKVTKYKCPICGWGNFRNVYGGVTVQCTKCHAILQLLIPSKASMERYKEVTEQFESYVGYIGNTNLMVEGKNHNE